MMIAVDDLCSNEVGGEQPHLQRDDDRSSKFRALSKRVKLGGLARRNWLKQVCDIAQFAVDLSTGLVRA